MGSRGVDRKNLIKCPNVKAGDLICIKRVWLLTPVSYVCGVVLGVRIIKWDKNYRMIRMLKIDGEVCEEPLNIVHDANNLEILT